MTIKELKDELEGLLLYDQYAALTKKHLTEYGTNIIDHIRMELIRVLALATNDDEVIDMVEDLWVGGNVR